MGLEPKIEVRLGHVLLEYEVSLIILQYADYVHVPRKVVGLDGMSDCNIEMSDYRGFIIACGYICLLILMYK